MTTTPANRRRRFTLGMTALAACCALAAPAAGQVYFVGAPEGMGGQAYALSDDGLVAAGWNGSLLESVGYTWTMAGGRRDFSGLPGVPSIALPVGISNDAERRSARDATPGPATATPSATATACTNGSRRAPEQRGGLRHGRQPRRVGRRRVQRHPASRRIRRHRHAVGGRRHAGDGRLFQAWRTLPERSPGRQRRRASRRGVQRGVW